MQRLCSLQELSITTHIHVKTYLSANPTRDLGGLLLKSLSLLLRLLVPPIMFRFCLSFDGRVQPTSVFSSLILRLPYAIAQSIGLGFPAGLTLPFRHGLR